MKSLKPDKIKRAQIGWYFFYKTTPKTKEEAMERRNHCLELYKIKEAAEQSTYSKYGIIKPEDVDPDGVGMNIRDKKLRDKLFEKGWDAVTSRESVYPFWVFVE